MKTFELLPLVRRRINIRLTETHAYITGKTYGYRAWFRMNDGIWNKEENEWTISISHVDEFTQLVRDNDEKQFKVRSKKSREAWKRKREILDRMEFIETQRNDPTRQAERKANFNAYVTSGRKLPPFVSPADCNTQCLQCHTFLFGAPVRATAHLVTRCCYCGEIWGCHDWD